MIPVSTNCKKSSGNIFSPVAVCLYRSPSDQMVAVPLSSHGWQTKEPSCNLGCAFRNAYTLVTKVQCLIIQYNSCYDWRSHFVKHNIFFK